MMGAPDPEAEAKAAAAIARARAHVESAEVALEGETDGDPAQLAIAHSLLALAGLLVATVEADGGLL